MNSAVNFLNQFDQKPKENNFEIVPESQHAHAIESKYGNFDFPTIPENDYT